MGQDFNIYDASIYDILVGGNGEIVVPSGGGAAVSSLIPGGEPVYTTTLPGGKTVTVDDHGNILNVN